MTTWMPLFEGFLCVHFLLLVSSLSIKGAWLQNHPTLKLRLERILFASCILSPLCVRFVKQENKSPLASFVSQVVLPEQFPTPTLMEESSEATIKQPLQKTELPINYWEIALLLFLLGSAYQAFKLLVDLRKVHALLRNASVLRSIGRITIKVSDLCRIPFSIHHLGTSYIVLPLSMLHTPLNMKLAIAHEGQHHRQGDCLWAYFTECMAVVFWGNPGLKLWSQSLSELQELACDEVLVGHQNISAHDYGHCLYQVAQAVSEYSGTEHRSLACAVGMAWNRGKEEKSLITRRICMLSRYQASVYRRSLFSCVVTATAIFAPLCTAYAAKGSLFPASIKAIDTSYLDPRFQKIAATEIAAAVERYKAKSGAIAIADPQTGKIIAFAESSSAEGKESWKTRLFALGSTIKPFVAGAAIDTGLASESKVYDCREPYEVSGTPFWNHDKDSGPFSLKEAMVRSVNVCFIKVAQDLGSRMFRERLARFGFDTSSFWRDNRSDALQLANASLGTTFPVTMESVTKAYAMLANHGRFFSNSGGAISETAADSVTRMLVETVDHGTGVQAALPGIHVAGKTGTLGPNSKMKLSSLDLELFGGYVPAEAPRFAAFVVIENGHRVDSDEQATGGTIAAPVFHDVALKSLPLLSQLN